MLPDRVSNPGPLTYESGALPIALRGSVLLLVIYCVCALLASKDLLRTFVAPSASYRMFFKSLLLSQTPRTSLVI